VKDQRSTGSSKNSLNSLSGKKEKTTDEGDPK